MGYELTHFPSSLADDHKSINVDFVEFLQSLLFSMIDDHLM